jgi:hypothetical protein
MLAEKEVLISGSYSVVMQVHRTGIMLGLTFLAELAIRPKH